MNEIKQVIVVRKDLKMRRGKESAQVAHASMKVFFDRMKLTAYAHLNLYDETNFTKEMKMWMNSDFKKVVVSCDSEKELLDIQNVANIFEIPNVLIKDSGLTEFKKTCTTCKGTGKVYKGFFKIACSMCGGTKKISIPTYTCLAIGPDYSEKIDKITGHLKLR